MNVLPLFGAYLKHYRSERGLTLRRIAEAVGVDPSYLSRLERGDIANPSEEILEGLASVLQTSKDEAYLAAGRITPELAGILEQGLPFTTQQAANLLEMLREHLGPLFNQLEGKPLADLIAPTDAETMGHINSAMSHVAELVQAMEQGKISEKQFEHVTETIRQLKLSLLTRHSETP